MSVVPTRSTPCLHPPPADPPRPADVLAAALAPSGPVGRRLTPIRLARAVRAFVEAGDPVHGRPAEMRRAVSDIVWRSVRQYRPDAEAERWSAAAARLVDHLHFRAITRAHEETDARRLSSASPPPRARLAPDVVGA